MRVKMKIASFVVTCMPWEAGRERGKRQALLGESRMGTIGRLADETPVHEAAEATI